MALGQQRKLAAPVGIGLLDTPHRSTSDGAAVQRFRRLGIARQRCPEGTDRLPVAAQHAERFALQREERRILLLDLERLLVAAQRLRRRPRASSALPTAEWG